MQLLFSLCTCEHIEYWPCRKSNGSGFLVLRSFRFTWSFTNKQTKLPTVSRPPLTHWTNLSVDLGIGGAWVDVCIASDCANDSETQKALWWMTHTNSSQCKESHFPPDAENRWRGRQVGFIPGRTQCVALKAIFSFVLSWNIFHTATLHRWWLLLGTRSRRQRRRRSLCFLSWYLALNSSGPAWNHHHDDNDADDDDDDNNHHVG